MKQNYVDHDKDKDNDNKPFDTENKFLNPIWMWVQKNTRLILYLYIFSQIISSTIHDLD